jgi:hypothetical protein
VTIARLAEILIVGPTVCLPLGEADEMPKINPKIAVYINRLMLRLFSVPSLITYLDDVGIVRSGGENGMDGKNGEASRNREASKNGDAGDEKVTIQLDFHRLPAEIIQQVTRLIAPPGKMKLKQYTKKDSARLGFEFDLHPKDLGGEDYDYMM